ncbi:MAG TPA: hypothetical protein VM409_06990 [Chloroflexia bacterium]|nr:hypothetical protein [Chloroflexia bacterium]
MFLGWFDDTRKKSAREKIEEAVERYVARFGENPNICLVNVDDMTAIDGMEVKVADYVRPNHFWVGQGELLERSNAA